MSTGQARGTGCDRPVLPRGPTAVGQAREVINRQSREQFVETLTSFPAQVLSIGSDNAEVHVLGDVAIVTGLQVAQLEFIGGTQVANRIAISNVFRRVDGHWWMVLSHAVELPPAS